MGTSLNDQNLYNHILDLFSLKDKAQFGDASATSKTPETLFASVQSVFPDKTDALQAKTAKDAGRYRQQESASFHDHLQANVNLYSQHYGRKTLNMGLYMTLFPHTHRCDSRGSLCPGHH